MSSSGHSRKRVKSTSTSAWSSAARPGWQVEAVGSIAPLSGSVAKLTVQRKPWRAASTCASIGSASSERYSSSPATSTTRRPAPGPAPPSSSSTRASCGGACASATARMSAPSMRATLACRAPAVPSDLAAHAMHRPTSFVVALLFWAAAGAPSVSAQESRAPLRAGDRVVLVGGALAERQQHDGWLETRLQLAFPALELSFRNLGFSADTLTVRQRVDGFGTPDEWLARAQADVVFAFWGFNESFDGE